MKKRIKIKDVDKEFSLLIRSRDRWRCQVCGLDCSNRKGYLDNSHYHSRSIMSTRFDKDNCFAFCKPCHMRWENRKTAEYGDWMKRMLGQARFIALKRRAYQSQYLTSYSQEDLSKLINSFKLGQRA